jgi:hypothetical protein
MRTPFRYSAPMALVSTVCGSVNERLKLPYARSTRWYCSSFTSLSIFF